jgi:hypothetical protein
MSDPLTERLSSAFQGAEHVHMTPPDEAYTDYGDGIRTPPGSGEPAPEDYTDYGDGIRTPPGSGEPAPDDYTDYGDGIRTPPAPSEPEAADLVGESVRFVAPDSVIGPEPMGSHVGSGHSSFAFGTGEATGAGATGAPVEGEAGAPVEGEADFGSGDPTSASGWPTDTDTDSGAGEPMDVSPGEVLVDDTDPLAADAWATDQPTEGVGTDDPGFQPVDDTEVPGDEPGDDGFDAAVG